MKIKDVRAHVLEAELSEPFSWSLGWTRTRSRPRTARSAGGASGGPARPNAAAVETMQPLLVGADALATEVVWESCTRRFATNGQKGLPVQALSGIDLALWVPQGQVFRRARVSPDGRAGAHGVQRVCDRAVPARGRRPRAYLAEEAVASRASPR